MAHTTLEKSWIRPRLILSAIPTSGTPCTIPLATSYYTIVKLILIFTGIQIFSAKISPSEYPKELAELTHHGFGICSTSCSRNELGR